MGGASGFANVFGGFPLPRVMGMVAGLLILLIGAFVLRAKPDSRLHQLFFALALADGVSTFAYDLAISPVSEFVRVNAFLVYFYAFVVFVGLLLAFGLSFPRVLLPRVPRLPVAVSLGIVTLLALALHAVRPELFWTPERARDGTLFFAAQGAGRVLYAAWVLVTAFIIVMGVLITRREPSPSHRLQGALVLGGMSLGYAPYATTNVITGFREGMSNSFFSSAPDAVVIYWASLLTTLAVVVAALFVIAESRADRRTERNVVLACLLGVLVLTLVDASGATPATADTLLVLALLAYPLLLGYAIIRYEVLDIDAHLRRAATASLIGAGFTAVFLLFEVFLEQIVQRVVSEETSAGAVAGPIAAVLVALVSIPLLRALRKLARRVSPKLAAHADLDVRKREIYRHALAGAAADGIIEAREMRVLERLRESLHITEAEHLAMMREIAPDAV